MPAEKVTYGVLEGTAQVQMLGGDCSEQLWATGSSLGGRWEAGLGA